MTGEPTGVLCAWCLEFIREEETGTRVFVRDGMTDEKIPGIYHEGLCAEKAAERYAARTGCATKPFLERAAESLSKMIPSFLARAGIIEDCDVVLVLVGRAPCDCVITVCPEAAIVIRAADRLKEAAEQILQAERSKGAPS